MQYRSSSDSDRRFLRAKDQNEGPKNLKNNEIRTAEGYKLKNSSSMPYIVHPNQVIYAKRGKYNGSGTPISNKDALRLSTNETQPRGLFREQTINQNYSQSVSKKYGSRINGNIQKQFDSSDSEFMMVRRNKLNTKSHQNLRDFTQQVLPSMPTPTKVSSYSKLISSETSPNLKLSKNQARIINDMHNEVLNQNLMFQQQQLVLQQQQTYEPIYNYAQYVEQPLRLSSSMNMRRPPLALNPHLQMKKQKLKELMNEQAAMDFSPPFTPAGQYIDRSIPSGTENGGFEYVYRKNYPRQIYKSYDRLDNRYLYEQVPYRYSQAPRKRDIPLPSNRNRVIEMWEYFTSRLLENQQNEGGFVRKQLENKIQKVRKGEDSLERQNTPIENWKKLLVQASNDHNVEFKLTGLSMINSKLRKRKEKINTMSVLGKWHVLCKQLIYKHNTQRGGRINKRWKQLVFKADLYGYINLKSVSYGGHSLKEMNSKLEVKNEKDRVMNLLNRWSRLIYGISRDDIRKQRSMQLCIKWASMSRKLVKQNKKGPSLEVQGRWNRLIRGIQQLGKKRVLRVQGRWNTLIRGIQQQGKQRVLRVQGRWNTLIRGIQQQGKKRVLRVQGRWNILIKGILAQNSRGSNIDDVTQRWINLVKGLDFKYSNLQLNNFKGMITRLRQKKPQEKVNMKACMNFKRLTNLLLRRAERQEKKMLWMKKQQQRSPIEKWTVLVKGMLKKGKTQDQKVEKGKTKWQELLDRMKKQQQERTPQQKWTDLMVKVIKLMDEREAQALEKPKSKWDLLMEKIKQKQARTPVQKWADLTKALLEKSEKQQQQKKPKTKWEELLQKIKMQQQRTPIEKWAALTKGLLEKSQKQAKKPKTKWEELLEKIKMQQQRTPIEKWAALTKGLLEKNQKQAEKPKTKWEELLERVKKQQERTPLEKWASLTEGIMKKSQEKKQKKKSKWELLMEKIKNNEVQIPQKVQVKKRGGAQKMSLQMCGKWAQLARKALVVSKQNKSIEVCFTWARLSRKLVQKDKIRRNKIYIKWKQISNQLVKVNNNRRLFVIGRFSNLIKRYVIMRAKKKTMKANGRLRKLTYKLLDKNRARLQARVNFVRLARLVLTNYKRQTAFSPIERWQMLLTKVLNHLKNQTNKTSWEDGYKQAKNKVIDPKLKNQKLDGLKKWATLIRGILKKGGQRSLYLNCKWSTLARKYLKLHKLKMQGKLSQMISRYLKLKWRNKQLQAFGRLKMLARKYTLYKFNQNRLQIYVKWTRMAQRMLTLYDDDHMTDRVMRRWQSMLKKFINRGKINSMSELIFKDSLAVRKKNRLIQGRWNKLISKMMYADGSFTNVLLHSVKQQSKTQKRWTRMMVKFRKKHGFGQFQDLQNDVFRQASINKRWRILMKSLDKKYQILPRTLEAIAQRQKTQTSIKNINNRPADAYIEISDSEVEQETPRRVDVSRMKVKKIKVKNPEQLKRKIQDVNYQREGRYSEDHPDYIRGLSTEQLQQEIYKLKNQLDNKQDMVNKLEDIMDDKMMKFNEEVELGKQRENKLMFFLYVLKEERKCPVTEVFDEYIKPIETNRFQQDYGDDYRKALKKIKKQTKYEKLYNKALRKMRNLNGNKEYKSDSCLPSSNVSSQKQMDMSRSYKDRGRSQINKKVINIKNQNTKNVVKIPTLDIVQLGNGNRVYNGIKNGPNLLAMQGGGQYGGQYIPGLHNQGFGNSEFDNYNYISSSSEDSAAKAKVKDIVFDPRQRKRLLDSVGVVTTRKKWNNLNSSE